MSNFTSFVDYDGENKPNIAISNHLTATTSSFEISDKQIDLMPNEIESCSCENVSFSMQFGESEQGKIVCTKVRLRFTPLVKKQREVPRRSRWFDDFYDISLCSVARVMVSLVNKNSTKGKPDKFHRMETNLSSMEVISIIRLVLKDMRVVTIDLRKSQNGTHLANQILFFSKSGMIEKMTQIGVGFEKRGEKEKISFNNYDMWIAELNRCGQKTDSSAPWRVCALHKEGFSNSAQGYPMYVVVPSFLSRTDLDRLMQNWKCGRIPIWTWSTPKGNATLLISADHERNIAAPDLQAKVIESITRCHPKSEKPHMINLDADFTNCVGKAYESLLSLCGIDSYEQFVERETSWNTKIHRTGWLHLIRACLSKTNETIRWLVNRERSVMLCEDESKDMAILVASLVQVCCDSFYRTTTGFQQLIEKMWIALGHPFGQRLLGRDDMASKRAKGYSKIDIYPVWLLFLDCCAQLARIHQFEFSFSEHFLIALWDVSLTGMVASLTCNNLEEQLASRVGGGPFPMSHFYWEEYRQLFSNVYHDAIVFMHSAKNDLPIGNSSSYIQKDVILPPISICDIHLWTECYLRWIPPANVRNGGKFSEMVQLDRKMLEISRKLKTHNEWKQHFVIPEVYSSAYPYSLPEIPRPIIGLNDSDDKSSDFEIVPRPMDFDTSSMMSSFTSMSFTQTPVYNTTIDSNFDNSRRKDYSHDLESSPQLKMQPKMQMVSYSKYESDDQKTDMNSGETPILSSIIQLPPTPARRHTGERPIPPPRPEGLFGSMKKRENDVKHQEDGNTVTRF